MPPAHRGLQRPLVPPGTAPPLYKRGAALLVVQERNHSGALLTLEAQTGIIVGSCLGQSLPPEEAPTRIDAPARTRPPPVSLSLPERQNRGRSPFLGLDKPSPLVFTIRPRLIGHPLQECPNILLSRNFRLATDPPLWIVGSTVGIVTSGVRRERAAGRIAKCSSIWRFTSGDPQSSGGLLSQNPPVLVF